MTGIAKFLTIIFVSGCVFEHTFPWEHEKTKPAEGNCNHVLAFLNSQISWILWKVHLQAEFGTAQNKTR